jgi:hypothetical protein
MPPRGIEAQAYFKAEYGDPKVVASPFAFEIACSYF